MKAVSGRRGEYRMVPVGLFDKGSYMEKGDVMRCHCSLDKPAKIATNLGKKHRYRNPPRTAIG